MIDAPDAAHIRQVHAGPGLRPARPCLARAVPGRADRRPPPGRRPAVATIRAPGWPGADWPALGRPARSARPRPGRRDAEDHRPDRAGPASARPAADAACSRRQHSPWLPAAARDAAARATCPRSAQPGGGAAPPGPVRPRRPARPSRPAARGPRPGHFRPPDGGRRAAQRPLPAAAHDRRFAARPAAATPTCTFTASTAATARCCRSLTCRTAARSQTLPEGELVGVRLRHAQLGNPTRAGRALLNIGDGNLVTVTVPVG